MGSMILPGPGSGGGGGGGLASFFDLSITALGTTSVVIPIDLVTYKAILIKACFNIAARVGGDQLFMDYGAHGRGYGWSNVQFSGGALTQPNNSGDTKFILGNISDNNGSGPTNLDLWIFNTSTAVGLTNGRGSYQSRIDAWNNVPADVTMSNGQPSFDPGTGFNATFTTANGNNFDGGELVDSRFTAWGLT